MVRLMPSGATNRKRLPSGATSHPAPNSCGGAVNKRRGVPARNFYGVQEPNQPARQQRAGCVRTAFSEANEALDLEEARRTARADERTQKAGGRSHGQDAAPEIRIGDVTLRLVEIGVIEGVVGLCAK